MSLVKLTLQPDESGKKISGFLNGTPLVLTATQGDTVGQIVARFNTYRSPDSQIKRLWHTDGTLLFFHTVLNTHLIGIVKAYSC
jgi:hypothetical protein